LPVDRHSLCCAIAIGDKLGVPQAIKIVDAEGRSAIYSPLEMEGTRWCGHYGKQMPKSPDLDDDEYAAVIAALKKQIDDDPLSAGAAFDVGQIGAGEIRSQLSARRDRPEASAAAGADAGAREPQGTPVVLTIILVGLSLVVVFVLAAWLSGSRRQVPYLDADGFPVYHRVRRDRADSARL
jgi:hypothetical protein